MNVDYGIRLASWRKEQQLSQRALGSLLAVSQGYIGDIEAGRTQPSRNFLQALSERFGVSADWILYGIGVPTSERASGFEAGKHGKRIEPPDLGKPDHGDFRFGQEGFFLFPRHDIDVSAGLGIIPVDGGEREMMAFSRSWVMQQRLNPDVSFLVRVRGDSMAPTLPDGALILVDCFDRDLSRPGIFVFNRGDETYVKRLVSIGGDAQGSPPSLKILSDNQAYLPDALVGEEMNTLQPVGRVRCVVTTLP